MKTLRSTLWVGSTYCRAEMVVKNLLELTYSLPRPMAIYRKENCLLTPGEYIENPWYFSALLVSSYNVETVVFVYRLGEPFNPYPPATAGAFNREVVGVIVVSKLIDETVWKQIQEAKLLLKLAGALTVCVVADKYENTICELPNICNDEIVYGYAALKNILIQSNDKDI